MENVWSRVVVICKKIHEPDLPFQVDKKSWREIGTILSQGAKEAVEMALRQEDNFGADFNSDDIPCFGYTIYSDPHVQVHLPMDLIS